MKLGYTLVYVSDVPASLAFFERAFGLARRFLHDSGSYGELDTGATTLGFAQHAVARTNLGHDYLAGRLEVSVRTVYRDVADLQMQGVPIEGEAGVGYRMNAGFDLPPLMFTHAEAQALVAAVRVAQPRIDAALGAHAESALSKILAVLPSAARAAAES